MSGYLPPHGTGGACSEIYKPEWTLQDAPLKGEDEDTTEHYLLLNPETAPTLQTLITLGPDPDKPLLKVHPIGFGLWGWGDVLTYGWGPSNGYDQKLNDDSVAGAWHEIFKLSNHVLLDTAEHYGYTDGYSESTVGKLLTQDGKDTRSKLVFATKFFPTPWRHPWKYPGITLQSASDSLERSKVGRIDIYQLHGPSHWGFWPKLDTLCEALAQAYTTGKVKAIETCNLSLEQVKYVYTYMRKVSTSQGSI
jgi:aryl-alcohol dehydrogenase-like predicted oxidoreductase